ncbi:variable large family protein (plasmid) [Borrelia miyamotoi]|uniref:variable large family protein n=1 Tax=Borrelia miyamotoi TaxID=47466 RepID=UPI0022B31E44|nr:variable large family protein [Borrelia miyamotoi]WAZ71375.1 variable large family protein [Borrelia miyamotoi]
MTLFLGFVSCNSSGTVAEESPQSRFLKSVISLGNDFLNVFTSFGNMVGGVLGFNTNTKKSDVGAYFKKVHDTVEGTKTSLEKIVADMKTEGNPNAEATDTAVKKLVSETLSKIIEGAKTASEAIGDAGDPIGNISTDNNGGAVGTGVDGLIKGIKSIVDVVLGAKEGNAEAGDNKKAEDGNTARNNDGAGKLFDGSTGAAADDKKAAADAAKAVGAVTGADILKAMVKDNGDAAKLAKNSAGIAASGVAAPKDAVMAGGIALRAMAKGGKFANGSNAADAKKIVEGVAVSAVTKALDTLTIAIRKTIDLGLKEVQEAMKINNAINASDTPVISDNKTSEAKSE